ncbi:plasma-membrane choline transporter-domain-containing protein [Suillus plorans]|uniref:Plasma-membrane choline transporter-domain-containing protein n=1 Tax=Suillus plorans TaxID=116603 RepID=A0A9P7ARB0_9AGAM|nr:plasma-membrane choline transporter-domain-containing protein [Suillus plorans]KAG1794850.1 plasma-membrane choline transporter-domain-containing protein [Suillus plorans]
MAKSFAQYASQFLTQQHNPASSLSSSQPLFFSFTTDEGSRAGDDHDTEVDDVDDPHLRVSRLSSRGNFRSRAHDIDDEDPYLRLDEGDDNMPGASHHTSQSIPLMASDYGQAVSQDYPKGWLAHQASPPRRIRSPLPSLSSSSLGSPEPTIDSPRPMPNRSARPQHPPPPPSRAREPVSLSLTESLLPRDGTTRPIDVFSLPDPRHITRARRKFNDSHWTIFWCTGVSVCVFFSILLLFFGKTRKDDGRGVSLPYTTLLHTVPLLTILTFLSALMAYVHVFLLRIFVRPVMIATSVFIPATLFISAIWAFVGSFMWDGDQEPTWGETVGLRLFSLVPLVLSVITARGLVNLPREIHSTSSILDLTTRLLIANPFLLALSPAMLLTMLVASIPFITVIFRLLLIGYVYEPNGTLEGHVQGWANWAIFGVVGVWFWSWGIAKGMLRTTCAGVIGAWYFADPDVPIPLPSDTHIIHAALMRAAYPSLGSIVLSALILTGIRLLGLLILALRWLPLYLPLALRPWCQPIIFGSGMAVSYLESVTTSLSKYALVYTGLTGDPFFVSARRARALTATVETTSAGRYRKKFKTEPPLRMLTYAPLTLTFPFALVTYLFGAHTLGAPDYALGASLLAGGVTALVGLFCIGLVKDVADTLYLCYCIDKDVGERHREEVFAALEYEIQPRTAARSQPQTATPPQLQAQPRSSLSGRPEQASPTGAQRPTVISPPLSDSPRVPQQFTPPSPKPVARPIQPAQPVRPIQPTIPDADIDPFEHEPIGFDAPAAQIHGYDLSPEPRHASVDDESLDEDDEHGEESQLFPGSGLF